MHKEHEERKEKDFNEKVEKLKETIAKSHPEEKGVVAEPVKDLPEVKQPFVAKEKEEKVDNDKFKKAVKYAAFGAAAVLAAYLFWLLTN